MGIAVLGPLLVAGAGNLSRRDRVVLAALAVRAGHPVRSEELIDALWGEHPPPSAQKILQGCIVRLRKVLGPDAIETSTRGYVLALPPDQLDSQRFERMVVRARELLALGQADRAAYQLTEALSLWNGDAFADLEEWQPGMREARRLHEVRLEAEELRVDALLRTGRHSEVLAEIQALVRAAPLREHRWVLQAHAQYQSGQQGEALRTLHQLRTVLTTKLGVDPGPDVIALEQAILRQDPSLLSGGAVTASGSTCPYQGLQAFDVDDADRFFGRQGDVEACLEVLRRTTLLALVGPSGSGKSSLMRAGLGAALRARGTPTVTITPGPRPVEALTALGSGPAGATLLVDQFEELFSLCENVQQQREFLRLLVEEAQTRTVVIALRADHLAALAAYGDFARLVERGLYIVGGLGEEGLAQAIEAPARQTGLVIEAGLVDLLVREVKDDPGALPLLSHVLLETWRRREGNTLTVVGYRASGAIHGAVAQSAEALYAKVEVEQRHTLRDLVLRLVTPGPQGEPVRSRVPRRMVATDTERDQLIEQLVSARLVTSDDGVLEITHEALARAWPRLRGWLDDDVEGQRMLHHLFAAADAWDSMERPDSELYRGVRLARILDWRAGSTTTLTGTEEAFLVASQEQAELEERSAEERAREQARLIGRLRSVLTGAVVLLVLALAAGGVAAVQSERAGDNAARAVASRQAAEQGEFTALVRQAALRSEATDDVDLSLLLAVAATRLDDSPESAAALGRALSRNPALISSAEMTGEDHMSLDLSPDDRTVAIIDAYHRVQVLDVLTGQVLAKAQAGAAREDPGPRTIEFSPDGETLAVGRTALSRGPIALLDARSLAETSTRLGGLPRAAWRAADVAYSEDGRAVTAALQKLTRGADTLEVDSTWAAVWRLDRPSRPDLVRLMDGGRPFVALSPDGGRLYSLPDGVVHDLRTGERAAFLPGPLGWDTAIELSPDGRWLAFGAGAGRGAALVDTRSLREVRRLGEGSDVANVRFDADGSRLLTSDWGAPRPARVWEVATGRLLADLSLTGRSALAVDLDAAGRTIVTAEAHQAIDSLRRWDVSGRNRYLGRVPVPALAWPGRDAMGSCFANVAPGAARVMYMPCAQDSYVFLDVDRRRTRVSPKQIRGVANGAGSWRADRPTFLRADGNVIREYDALSARPMQTRQMGGLVADVAYSPDGTVAVAAELTGAVTLLDADSLEPLAGPVRLDASVVSVGVGADNHTAFVVTSTEPAGLFWSSWPSGWALLDLQQGVVTHAGELGFYGNWGVMSPTGDRAVVTGIEGGEVLLLDLVKGKPVRPFVIAHPGNVSSIAFSTDGSRLITGAEDGSVVLWDSETATQLARVSLPNAGTPWAGFRPDGTVVLAPTGAEPALYVWDPNPDRAIEFACRAAGRELTEAEWRDAFGDLPHQDVCTDP
ncbi:MAG: BTAD domain-containing putative transcriptional regulator [Nocardioides sp.]|uniref:nSTAND1 domain-containing NTPase n=1 Tax=Nocardioides sp. TaxID=35761 RepID=UPI003262D3F0